VLRADGDPTAPATGTGADLVEVLVPDEADAVRSRPRSRLGRRPFLRGSPLVVVSACVASIQMSWSLVVPVLPIYARMFGLGAAQLGLVLGVFGVGRVLVNIPAGLLADRLDRRWLLLASMLGVVATQVLTGLAPGYWVLLGLRLATGVAGGVAITSGMSLLADLTTVANRGRDMATLQAFQLIGGSLGPVVGGFLAVLFGPRLPFLVSGVAAVGIAVWARHVLAQAVRPASERVEAGQRVERQPDRRRAAWFTRDVAGVCALGFSVFFHRFGGMQALVPMIAYGAVGISVAHLGLILGGITVCNVLVVRFAGGLSDRIGRRRVILPAMAVVTLGCAGLAPAHSVLAFVAATLVTGVAAGFSGPTPAAYLADVVAPQSRGTAVGVYRTFGDLGTILGPILLGVTAQIWGYGGAALVLAAIVAVTTLMFGVLSRETTGPRRVLAGAG
jgi:MFS family permease